MLHELARAYVQTLHSAPNGLGQHVHPAYGRSDAIMLRMVRAYGDAATDAAIDAAMKDRRHA
jgi:hypothetical protein